MTDRPARDALYSELMWPEYNPTSESYGTGADKANSLLDALEAEARAATPAGPAPATDRDQLRQRIAEALIEWTYRGKNPEHGGILETVRANAYSRADAVLAVLPAPTDRAAEAPLSPFYEHPECGFHWHGQDGMDIPIRDGQPVCPRCELAKTEKKLAAVQHRRDEVGAECKRRGKRVLEQSERILALERQVDEVHRQLGGEILRAGQAEAELRRLAGEAHRDPRCAHCTHPKGDHDGRADHREKHSPLVAGEPWCHACNAECDYTSEARQDPTQDGEAATPDDQAGLAAGLRAAADEIAGIDFHSNARARSLDIATGLARRLRRLADEVEQTPTQGGAAAFCGAREPEPRTGTSPCVLPSGHGGSRHQDKWTNQWPIAAVTRPGQPETEA